MQPLKNDRIIKALFCEPVDATPIWIMRQAGRYLPEFRALRAKVPDFLKFCKNPELACEVTLQPLARFDLDAAIIFSDILTVVDALGFNLEFLSNVGPVVHNPVRSQKDLARLSIPFAMERLQYVFDAVKLTERELQGRVPLIGFAGSPWTVACYMVQGKNQHNFQQTRALIYQEPALMHFLLKTLTELTIHYLNQQIEAGARIIMLFDTWGGILSTDAYREFSLYYMQEIGRRIHREFNQHRIPLIFFTKNGGQWLEEMANSGCDAVGIDWTQNINDARSRVGHKVALQGNLDPMTLLGTPEAVRHEVKKILQRFGAGSGHIFNLGHGIDKSTPIENVQVMVNTVREWSRMNMPRPQTIGEPS